MHNNFTKEMILCQHTKITILVTGSSSSIIRTGRESNNKKWKRGFATKKEALAFERDFLEKQSANPDMTLQNLFELYMEDMTARLKPSTILTKKNIYRTHILPFFDKKPVNEIKASDVRRWQNQLMNSPKGYSKTYLKTINNQLTCLINYAKTLL